jgi:hypothetical protein
MVRKYFFMVVWSMFSLLLFGCESAPLKQPVSSHPSFKVQTTSSRSSSIPSSETTLHAIIVADTYDRRVGKSVEVDLKNMRELVESITENTGILSNHEFIYGDDFNLDNVSRALNNLSVNEDDIVVFYYAGHGFNSGKGSIWPSMKFKEKSQSLDLDWVKSTLEVKNPRFFIAMVDACNSFFEVPTKRGVRGTTPTPLAENYRQLFLNYRGHVVVSSASPDQEAGGDPKNGGYFTKKFLDTLRENLASSNPDWHTIMRGAESPIYFPDNRGNEQQQNPQSEVKVERSLTSVPPDTGNSQLSLQVLPSTNFQIGDTMRVRITNQSQQENGYLFVWDINSAGKLTRLLPSVVVQEHRLPAGQTINIPEHDYSGFSLDITEPTGKGYIMASLVASQFRQTVLSANLETISATQAQTALQQVRERLNQMLGTADWSIATVEYEIVR